MLVELRGLLCKDLLQAMASEGFSLSDLSALARGLLAVLAKGGEGEALCGVSLIAPVKLRLRWSWVPFSDWSLRISMDWGLLDVVISGRGKSLPVLERVVWWVIDDLYDHLLKRNLELAATILARSLGLDDDEVYTLYDPYSSEHRFVACFPLIAGCVRLARIRNIRSSLDWVELAKILGSSRRAANEYVLEIPSVAEILRRAELLIKGREVAILKNMVRALEELDDFLMTLYRESPDLLDELGIPSELFFNRRYFFARLPLDPRDSDPRLLGLEEALRLASRGEPLHVVLRLCVPGWLDYTCEDYRYATVGRLEPRDASIRLFPEVVRSRLLA